MSLRQTDHEGKIVFVGIDVHKKTYAVSVRGEHMPKPMKLSNLRADPMALAKRLHQTFQGATINTVYEAGFAGFVLHRVLTAEGIHNIVVNPASIEVAANNRVKTDKRDADKMAEHLMRGRLTGIRVPSVPEELMRLYTRTRQQLVEHRTAVGNQIKSKLAQFGYLSPDDDALMSMKLLKEIKAMNLPLELAVVVRSLSAIYESLTDEIKALEKKIGEQANDDIDNEKVYRSVPGFGPISSRIFANELGDLQQFKNQKALFSFMGLTPSEYSSGDKEYKGSITRQGRTILRSVIVEVAWRAIRKDANLAKIYEHIKQRRGGKKAIVAVARRLVGRIRSCFTKKEAYKIGVKGVIETGKVAAKTSCRAVITSTKHSGKSCRLATPTAAASV